MEDDESLELVVPLEEMLAEYLEGCRENWNHVHDRYIVHNPDGFESWRHTIFDDYRKAWEGIGLPDGFVPNATFWISLGGHYAGTVNVRLSLTERLREYGGNTGIVVRRSLRGRGIGRRAFVLAVEKSRELGVSPVMVTCTESNVASLSMMRSSGLVPLRSECGMAEVDGKMVPVRRLWF